MNLVHSSLTVGAERAAALAALGSPPRRTWASHSWASERACSTVSSPYRPKARSEEHTSELQSQSNLVCRLLLEKKKKKKRLQRGNAYADKQIQKLRVARLHPDEH